MNRGTIASICLLLAAIPTVRWYLIRLQDGGSELAGLVPLAAAIWFAFRDRKELQLTSNGIWTAVVLLLIQAAAFPFLPAMIRALLMLAAAATATGTWRKPGVTSLLVLALPWTASLEFFLGYPLRLLTSINAKILLEILGIKITRFGVQLLYGGHTVGVDPACSGMNLLWSTALLTAILAAVFSLSWRKIIPLGFSALILALAGNSLRAAVLFFPEAGIIEMPHLLHSGIGLAIAGICFLILTKLAHRLSTCGTRTLVRITPIISRDRSIPILLLTIASPLVLLTSLISVKTITHPIPQPPILTHYQGTPLTRIPLSASEKKFYRNFPGSIAVYETAELKLIVRQVNRATRKLHPASHCLRAEGFRIGEKTVRPDENGKRWLSYTINRNSETFLVKERITSSTTNQVWQEISAWYWYALFHPGEGSWEAVTVIVDSPF